ncbi:hypothetical protein ACHAXR_007304 [Thalassiosira sp. AJA248-18]
MPTSQTLFILALAYASTSCSCAFQSGAPLSVVVGNKVTTSSPASSSVRRPASSSSSRCYKQLLIASYARQRRLSSMLESNSSDEQQLTVEVELYNDNGEEVLDIEIDLENIEDDIDEFYSLGVGGKQEVKDDNDDEEDDVKSKKKLIECSASIALPFSEDVAFDAFADLTRQPSWCKYLHSVEYIGLVDGEDGANGNVPLRKSKWTVGVKGLRFSWTASDTRIVRPNKIEWESTSGLKNMGSVEFVPQQQSSSTSSTATAEGTTQMILCFSFVAPRVVSSLFRRSGKIRKYTEDVMLMNMLSDFRDVVMEEDL